MPAASRIRTYNEVPPNMGDRSISEILEFAGLCQTDLEKAAHKALAERDKMAAELKELEARSASSARYAIVVKQLPRKNLKLMSTINGIVQTKNKATRDAIAPTEQERVDNSIRGDKRLSRHHTMNKEKIDNKFASELITI